MKKRLRDTTMRTIILLALLISIPTSQAEMLSMMQGLGKVDLHTVAFADDRAPLAVLVRAPESAAEKLPTIYLLDGGLSFPLLSAYYHSLRFVDELPQMIIVGISYGSDTFEEGNHRASDYTAPSPERANWGGAAAFRRWLKSNVIGLVENNYPSDPARRILFGQSLGGQFVLFSLLEEPDLFWGYIASNPALHRNLDLFLQQPATRPLRAPRVFISSSTRDAAQFRTPALTFIEHANAAGYPWQLRTRTDLDGTHMSAVPGNFRAGIRWLFEMP